MIKTKKIAAGYYEGTYKGVLFSISKVDTTEVAWYWQIGNAPANDWHSSKKIAIDAVKEYIDDEQEIN